jgi:Ca2+-binding EF-hand superfamily protein
MRGGNRILLLPVLALALGATSPHGTSQRPQNPRRAEDIPYLKPYVERFNQLDRNHDGYVSLDEWPLDAESFHRVDRNQDGRLSRTELLTPNVLDRSPRDQAFRAIDLNHDGRLSPYELQRAGLRVPEPSEHTAERPITLQQYESIWNSRASLPDQRQFQRLDRNGDGRLTRTEWIGAGTAFNSADRNQDGVISPNEWPGPPGGSP